MLSDFTAAEEIELSGVMLKCMNMLYDSECFPKHKEEIVEGEKEDDK